MFKSARFIRLTHPFLYDEATMREAISKYLFKPCGDRLKASGWAPVCVTNEGTPTPLMVVEATNLMRLRTDTKKVSQAVVKERLAEKVVELKEELKAEPGRMVIKEAQMVIEDNLLKEAVPVPRFTLGYTHNNWLVIESTSDNMCDEFISMLRKTLGSLPATLLKTNAEPSTVMKSWLLGEVALPDGFALAEECELVNAPDKSTVKFAGFDLTDECITTYLESGMTVRKLSLVWNESVAFTVSSNLELSKIKQLSWTPENTSEGEDAASQTQANLFASRNNLDSIMTALTEAFGGLRAEPQNYEMEAYSHGN